MTSPRHRLESLDVLRGISIAAMILVNNPGDWNAVFPPLLHADWNGWTLADTVFPFFVFIMGCAMPFAFARRDEAHNGEWRARVRVVRRAAILFGLGVVLNLVAAFPSIGGVRIPGVLQRLALAYAGAALIVRSTGALSQAVIAIALVAGHWLLMTLTPFGLTRDHNLAGFIDAHAFGSHTLMPGFDPEGLLGTLPTIATALVGALAGQWLRVTTNVRRQIAGLAIGAMVLIAAGLAWSTVWPINKPLWTGSYAIFMSGLAALTLAACLFLVDMLGVRRWALPFLALGANPLAIYFGSEFVGHILDRYKHLIFWSAFGSIAGGGEWASFLFALAYVGCWLVVSVVLYRRHIHIRV